VCPGPSLAALSVGGAPMLGFFVAMMIGLRIGAARKAAHA
jgi:hypothetical protein